MEKKREIESFLPITVKQWLDFGETDLLSAEKLTDEERLTKSASFHCHQAVEKYLKALL
jgi:HEPN domain-containing protein